MIIWYGERGVINAMVTYLVQKNGADNFLRCVQWANGLPPIWIERIRETKFVVEVGLAEFGNPDLMLVCRSSVDPRPFCVFLEAKVIPYIASAIPNNGGMSTRGYNSSCNGQLSLKYRFAKALGAWDGHRDRIEEPVAIHQAYRRAVSNGGLGDPQSVPRKLQKPSILNQVLVPLGIAGLPLDHFCFVALTWDRDAFFRLGPDYLPRFYDESGIDIFASMASQNGWIGYHQLSAVPGLVEAIKPALDLMVGSIIPSETDVIASTWPRLISQAVEQMDQDIQKLMRDLEQLGVQIFGPDAVQFHAGSLSIKSPSRVEAKIVPQERSGNRSVLLGIRPEWPIEKWSRLEACGYRVMDQPFRFVKLPARNVEALGIAESILRQLSDVLE